MPFELQYKEIVVCGESFTVHQASNLMDSKRALMISEANDKWKGADDDDIETQALRYLATLLYPSLVSCTTGNVPTLEEFLNGMPVDETEIWVVAAQEMNPQWFPDFKKRTPEEEEEDNEKKEN